MNKQTISRLSHSINFILLFGMYSHVSWCIPSLFQAKHDLNKIEMQVQHMQSNIEKDKNKQKHIQSKIHRNLDKINTNLSQQQQLEQQIHALRQQVQLIETHIQGTKFLIHTLKSNIQKHLLLHLHLTQEPVWEIVFNAQNPFEYYQQLELIQYLYHSEQHKISELKESNKTLYTEQHDLHCKQDTLAQLQTKLIEKLQNYRQQNQIQQAKLQQIQQQLNQKTSELHSMEQNQNNLRQLIQNLLKENHLQSHKPFSVLKKNLIFPIQQNTPHASLKDHGLLFQAPNNTSVYAVSSGQVVFSDWLNGYGYLLILDHGWGFMTLYGNNQQLLKHKGEFVKQGEFIAKSGNSGAFKQPGLYFEIRQHARVISARTWFKSHIA